MEFILLVISYLLRTYGAVQEERGSINTPLIWQSDFAKTALTVIWIILLAISAYLIYTSNGAVVLIISLLVYFFLAPMLFGKLIKKLLDRLGI